MNAIKPSLRIRDFLRHGPNPVPDAELSDEASSGRRRHRLETLIYVCWGLIVLKCFVVVWAVSYFAMPFNPMWVIGPTVTAAFIATALYYLGRD